MIRKRSSVYVLAHSGFVSRCCPIADSKLFLELLFLQRRGGCSLTGLHFTTQKSCVVYEFSCRCQAQYVGCTTQKLADRIKQHVPTSIRKKSNTVREQPPRLCKNNNSKINCESAIGQHLLTNPECAKTYTDDRFRIIGQARSSFHLSVLESVYIKTQNPVLCKQKYFIFSLEIFK